MGKRKTVDEYLTIIKNKCEKYNYNFFGFCDKKGNEGEWVGCAKTYLNIFCNKCKKEWITSYESFIYKDSKCIYCVGNYKKGNDEALNIINKRAKEIDVTFIGFENLENKYLGASTYLNLRCNHCGYVWKATYSNFLKEKCPKCARINNGNRCRKPIDKIKKEIDNRLRDLKDDISFLYFVDSNKNRIEYNNKKTLMLLHCNICGYEWTPEYYHFVLRKSSCPQCAKDRQKTTEAKALETCNDICSIKDISLLYFCDKEGNKTSWDCINKTYGKFSCNKCGHEWIISFNTFFSNKGGCPKCNSSNLEREIEFLLKRNRIAFEIQKKFEWLRFKKMMKIDFYLPRYNVGIECQGEQHFTNFRWEKDNEKLVIRKTRDRIKYELCKEHGVKLLYYSNLGINYPYEVFEDKEKLLEEIKKHGDS